MKTDLKHLRELCDAATQGEWTYEDVFCPDGDQTYRVFADREPLPTSGWEEDEAPNLLLADTHYYPLVPHKDDANFIAATDPTTVRALIDEIERLRGALEEIAEHGVSQPGALNMPEERWAWRCFNNLQYIARQALKGQDDE